MWDPRKAAVRHDLGKQFKGEMIAAAAFSPDGKVLASARGGEIDGTNGKVTLLDPATGKKLRELTPGHLNGATDVAFHPDGKTLYSAGRDTVVRAWRVADGKLLQELGKPRGGQFKDWIHAIAVAARRPPASRGGHDGTGTGVVHSGVTKCASSGCNEITGDARAGPGKRVKCRSTCKTHTDAAAAGSRPLPSRACTRSRC